MRPSTRTINRVVPLVLVGAIALTACGSGGGTAEPEPQDDPAAAGDEGGTDGGTDVGGEGESGDVPVVRFQAVEGSVGGLPLMVMEQEGLDEQFGFEGDFQFLASEGATQNFLMGETDVAMDSDIIGTAIARTEGFEVQAFYPVGNLYLGIIVPEDSPAQDPTDLIGKKVGHFGMDSGTTSFLSVVLEDAYDIDITEDYEFTEVGPAALGELLASGEIDAMFNFESFTSQAIVNVPGRWLLKAHEAYQETYDGFAPWITNMVAHTEWLEQNPETAYAVRDAYDEALRLLEDSDYQIANDQVYMDALGIEDQEVMDVMLENAASTPYFTNEWSEETIADAEAWLQQLVEKDILLEEVPEGVMTTLEETAGPRP